jgi:hypothetical protein
MVIDPGGRSAGSSRPLGRFAGQGRFHAPAGRFSFLLRLRAHTGKTGSSTATASALSGPPRGGGAGKLRPAGWQSAGGDGQAGGGRAPARKRTAASGTHPLPGGGSLREKKKTTADATPNCHHDCDVTQPRPTVTLSPTPEFRRAGPLHEDADQRTATPARVGTDRPAQHISSCAASGQWRRLSGRRFSGLRVPLSAPGPDPHAAVPKTAASGTKGTGRLLGALVPRAGEAAKVRSEIPFGAMTPALPPELLAFAFQCVSLRKARNGLATRACGRSAGRGYRLSGVRPPATGLHPRPASGGAGARVRGGRGDGQQPEAWAAGSKLAVGAGWLRGRGAFGRPPVAIGCDGWLSASISHSADAR